MKLILLLHARHLERPSWVVVNADSSVKEFVAEGDPSTFAAFLALQEIIVLVPAEDVLITTVSLPPMAKARMMQALPYAMEDQLIEEVADLHFAMGTPKASDKIPVAVVAKEKMQQWLDLLASWNVQPSSLIPLTLALPYEENTWSVLLGEMAVVRTEWFNGFGCDLDNLAELLNIALLSCVVPPQSIRIENVTADGETNVAAADAIHLERSIPIAEHNKTPAEAIQSLAHAVEHLPNIDLLQGAYANKKSKFLHINKLWKASLYLSIAWIFLLFLYPTVSYFILKNRVNSLNQEIVHIYHQQFPQATSIVAPKLRMEEKLQKMLNKTAENRLLVLLGYLGAGMTESAGITLKRIEFQNNQLSVELVASHSEVFSHFTDYLTNQGLKVKQQSAHLSDSRINSTIIIE